ncbi:MAG: hypothetical protein ACI4RP_01140 [Acutalibacteraceae bacterium]
MAVCTFFGHHDCPNNLYVPLRNKIEDLILYCNVDLFYVGNNGNFDEIVRKALAELKLLYPSIRYYVVPAYMPQKGKDASRNDCSNEIYPCALMKVPYKAAIPVRNKWMVKQSEFVIAYVKRSSGGAARFSDLAKRHGRRVFNLAK